jgi:hypothetical protein
MEYAVYSNIKFVEDILQHAGDYANLPVLNWWLTDSGMRIRFAAVDDPTYGLMHFDTSATSHAPLAMVEIWNSEVAQRKVGLRGGMYKLICGNGMCHWSAASEQTWIHRGDADRIQRGVSNAFQAVLRTATEVCDAYSSASDVSVKNPSVWLTQQLTKEKVPEKTITDMVKALRDPTTTPGNTLASVIDAITLVAHSTKDMDKQEEFESVAARILNYGLTVANGNGGEIK